MFGRKVRCAETLPGCSQQWRAGSTLARSACFLKALGHGSLHETGWLGGQPQMLPHPPPPPPSVPLLATWQLHCGLNSQIAPQPCYALSSMRGAGGSCAPTRPP